MNESFSTQAGFCTSLYFYIFLLGFFSSCPSLDVEGLDVVEETVLVTFAFWLHSGSGEESQSGVPELTARSDSGGPLQRTSSCWEMSSLPKPGLSLHIPLALCAGLSLYFLLPKSSFKLGFQVSK